MYERIAKHLIALLAGFPGRSAAPTQKVPPDAQPLIQTALKN